MRLQRVSDIALSIIARLDLPSCEVSCICSILAGKERSNIMAGHKGRIVYNSKQWQIIRQIVKKRDGYKCLLFGHGRKNTASFGMSARIEVYGYLGADAFVHERKDRPMTTARIAVHIPVRSAEYETIWFGMIAFGGIAVDLAKCHKGEPVSISGSLRRYRNGFSIRASSVTGYRRLRRD